MALQIKQFDMYVMQAYETPGAVWVECFTDNSIFHLLFHA